MKKIFISVPFRGKTEKEIKRLISLMTEYAEKYIFEKVEPVHNYIDYSNSQPSDTINYKVYCLSKAIEKMSKCDYFIGFLNTEGYPGCTTEVYIAQHYMNYDKVILIDEKALE